MGACGAIDVVAFPGVAIPESSEGWGGGTRVSQRTRDLSSPLRAGYGASQQLVLWWRVKVPTLSQKTRQGWGTQREEWAALGSWWCRLTAGSSTPQDHPLCGWSFSARNDKILRGLAVRLTWWPSRAWRFPNPRRDGVGESVSRKGRETLRVRSGQAMGHPSS